IDDRGRRLEATAVPVHDADSIRRVSEALQRKYARDEGLAEMLEASSLDATFRLEPRTADEVPLEAPAFLGADEPSELGPPVDVSLLDAGPPGDESVILQPHKPAGTSASRGGARPPESPRLGAAVSRRIRNAPGFPSCTSTNSSTSCPTSIRQRPRNGSAHSTRSSSRRARTAPGS